MNTIAEYADVIMIMICDDAAGMTAIRSARCFADLHDHVDANEYMIYAEVPYEPDDAAVMDAYVAVQDEVTRRLTDGLWVLRDTSYDERATGA